MLNKLSTSSPNPCFIREKRDALVFQNNPDFRVGAASRAHHKFGFKFGPPWILASKDNLGFVLQFGPFFFDLLLFFGPLCFVLFIKGTNNHIKSSFIYRKFV